MTVPCADAVPVLALVVPCYNEQEVFPETLKQLRALLAGLVAAGQVRAESRIWFVDDGSRDATWSLIESAARDPSTLVCGIKLSRNQGHQFALLAGLMHARGDILVSLDADLQDDLAVIPQMIEHYRDGADIVYGVRSARTTDTLFKRLSAEAYYKLLRRMGVEMVFNHADYRLMSRRAIESLRRYEESNLFLRGLIPLLGYRSAKVEYARAVRFAGESKYPLRRMIALAWQGVTSFSAVPLRTITALGLLVSLLSVGMGLWALGVRLLSDSAVPGWASIVIPQFLLSGVQLLSLGVIGEYLAKIFHETKRRPRYLIDTIVGSARAEGGQDEWDSVEKGTRGGHMPAAHP
ncbi:glycosyltransferase family 2 protein [Candidatus Accumulibacter contiguus]|jgi:glycosyltransferase involved in cell wall biosynthesis|uniref:Glycosyltransferase n=1 Tax=Candidatus Accumulibacter contiguus TaxID=2954381 RepID=A0ABX1TBK8_9PROT|nr:glycosyltransferase [Candidatus Accumulibacter contiguus]